MQAIILTHSEPPELSQLTTSNFGGLLPFGRGTLLSNIIDLLLESDISDILLVHQDVHHLVMEQFLSRHRPNWPAHTNIILCALPPSCPVLECFQRLRPHINADYVILIDATIAVTDLDFRHPFLTLVRNCGELVAVFSSIPTAESKILKSVSRELVLLQNNSDKLLGYFAANEIKKHSTLPRLFTEPGSDVLIRTDLREIGLYMITRSCLDVLARFRDDAGHRKKTMGQFINALPANSSGSIDHTTAEASCTEQLDSISSETGQFYQTVKRSCGAFLYEHRDEKVCIKLDSPFLFAEAIRLTFSKSPGQKKGNYLTDDCHVDSTATIRSSFIDSGCVVGPGVEIINSVLLRATIVKQGSYLQGCVLGENVTVEEGCKLKNCAAAASQRVPTETVLEGELLGFTDPELEAGQT